MSAEHRLPAALLKRASLCGGEYAWPIVDIPEVIEAARSADLVSLGGQLQFRFPAGTCECYWIDVDPFRSLPRKLSRQEKISRSADQALIDFARLVSDVDFTIEGRKGFPVNFESLEREGRDPVQFACFVWYVSDADDVIPTGE